MTGEPDREGAHPHDEDDRPEREPVAGGPHREIDVDSAFAAIVAAWGQETPGGVGRWPAIEDLELPAATPEAEEPARPARPEQPPRWNEPPADEPGPTVVHRADHRVDEERADDRAPEPDEDPDVEAPSARSGDGPPPMRPRRPRRGRHARRRGDQENPKDARPEPDGEDRTIELPRESGFEIEDRDQGGEPYRPSDRRPRRWGPAEDLGPSSEPLLPAGYGTGDLAGEPLEDEAGRFVPPDPPPIPRGDLVSRLAWGAVLGGPLFLLIAVLLWRDVPRELLAAAVVAFIGGFVVLVARMPGDHDGDGDGAVV